MSFGFSGRAGKTRHVARLWQRRRSCLCPAHRPTRRHSKPGTTNSPLPRRIPLGGRDGAQTPSIPCRTDEATAARHVPSAVQPVLPAQPSVAALSAPSASFWLRHQTRAAPSHCGRGPAGNGVRLSPSPARQGSNRPLLVFSWLFQAPATWRGDIKASSLISKAQTPT